MAAQDALFGQRVMAAKAILQQLGHQGFVAGEGGDVVAKIAGGQDAEFFAQTAATPPIIGDGDDGGEVGGVFFEAAQECGKPRAPADGDNFGATVAPLVFIE